MARSTPAASTWVCNSTTLSGQLGIDISNGSAGTFTFTNMSITNTGADAFRVTGGGGNINWIAGSLVNNNNNNSVEIVGRTGGAMTIGATVNDTGEGMRFNTNFGGSTTFSNNVTLNTGATIAVDVTASAAHGISFNGTTTDIDTTSANAINVNGGGTIGFGGTTATITTTITGRGVNIDSTTIGVGGVTFESVSVYGADSGIVLNNTGTTGGFTVTGDGGTAVNGSGGTIQNTTGDGIVLNSTNNVTIEQMNITNITGDGIDADDITGNSFVRSSRFTALGANEDGIDWFGEVAATVSLTVSSSFFQGTSGATGNRGIALETQINAYNATLTVNDVGGGAADSIFDRLAGSGVIVTAGANNGSGMVNVNIDDTIFQNAEAATLG